jgi:DNA-binding GntR family transcriptional regulator
LLLTLFAVNANIVFMTIWIPDLSSHRGPRYLAIADALAIDIRSSRLSPGDRLPTHRELAYQLGVTVGTVTRAYGEAERRGLIGGEVGRGTFVRSDLAVRASIRTNAQNGRTARRERGAKPEQRRVDARE